MATIIVDTNSDKTDPNDNRTTLREAIIQANTNTAPGDPDLITFNLKEGDRVIRLSEGEIEITDDVEIDGGGLVIITGDAEGNDTLVNGSFITDVAATLEASRNVGAGGVAPYEDNSRIFNITDGDTTTLKGLTLTGGRNPDFYGGVVNSSADLVLENVTVSENWAPENGGGVTGVNVELINSTVSGNAAEQSAGGVIAWSTATLINSTVSGNTAAVNIGGLYAPTLNMTNSTVSGNVAGQYAGGIGAFDITLANSTVSGNTAGVRGGGIDTYSGSATLDLTNSIVLGNSAPDESNIHSDVTINAVSSLYTNEDPEDVFAETTKIANGVYAGVLADNGGPTQTIQILAGGLAHNRGTSNDLTTDQRGERRVVNGAIDIGAVELNRAPVVLNDSTSTNSDTKVSGLLLTNDSDIDGDSLTVSTVNGQEAGSGSAIRLASGALLLISENGEFTYDPDGAFDDVPLGTTETDSFEYTATDGEFDAPAMATIAIAGQAIASTSDGATEKEQITGTNGPDLITCQDGNNRFFGLKGSDTICGGHGDDTVLGGKGRDHLSGSSGNDLMRGAKGNDLMSGGKGNDTLLGGEGHDKTFGLAGEDELRGGSGNDTVKGGASSDKLHGGLDHDLLMGGKGGDNLFGGAGNDILHGGAGSDVLRGGRGNDLLFGDAGDDNFHFEQGNDHVHGGAGEDALIMAGDFADYDISFGNGEVHVQRGNDMTTAVNIETLRFDDAIYLVDELRDLL